MTTVDKFKKKKNIKLLVLGIFITVIGTFIAGNQYFLGIPQTPVSAQTPCQPNPPATISSQPPMDVCSPQPSGIPFQFFDDFSWRSFVALVWPAKPGQRGVPDTSKTVGDESDPLVFETYKADWEVFQPNGAAPAAWNDYGGTNPCSEQDVKPQFGDLVLASFSKFANLGQAGFGPLVGPLVAQNQTYVRYQAAFDQIEFNQILSQQLYLKQNLGTSTNPLIFNNGSIDIKSAWIDMTGIQHPERFHKRIAWVFDTVSNECSQKSVGLVGLHIVVKTAHAPQWIWASFEQIDNIPENGAQSPFTFNDGTGTVMPTRNPIPFPPPAQAPSPFNVTRTMPIAASTQQTNVKYQQALKSQGSGVWQFYQLVMTQWPVPQDSPNNPGSPNRTFPGTGATTSFANTTMETFFQANVVTSCMACHNLVQKQTDFNWTLANHAFSPTNPLTPSDPGISPILMDTKTVKPKPLTPELRRLKALMETGRSRPETKPTVKRKPNPRKPVKSRRKNK